MKQELENKLFQKFSWLETKNQFTGKNLNIGISMDCDDGWYNLINELCTKLENYYKKHNANINELNILQIKEKYGVLCFYIGNFIDGAYKIIIKYENKSAHICETCGKHGKIKAKGNWLKCLCKKCAKKYEYYKLQSLGGKFI